MPIVNSIMAMLLAQKARLLITCGLKAITSKIGGENYELLDISDISSKCSTKTASRGGDEEATSITEAHIVAADISTCEKYIVLCTSDKQLSLWETDNLSLISNRTSARITSKVRFVPSGRTIVLADKSGSAYRFSVEKPHEDGELLLGHVSMLLDILVSPDERYIITCDRDEKIRVSRYPNAYSIQSYCLGHTEFITGLSLLPTDETVLVSSSGDGTVRFWDYVAGVALFVVNCNSFVPTHRFLDDTLPVTHISTCRLDSAYSLLCTCVSKFQGCLVYLIRGQSINMIILPMQVLKLQAEPWDISLTSERKLWVLGAVDREPLCVFMWDCDNLEFVACSDMSVAVQVNSRWDLFQSIAPPVLLPLLYKRRFDNNRVYQERGIHASSCSDTSTE